MDNQSTSPPSAVALNFVRRSGDRISAQGIGLAGLAGLAGAWLVARQLYMTDSALILTLFLACTALPMALLSFAANRVWRRTSSGISVTPRPIDVSRCIVKFTGLAATLIALAFCYWLFPEYAKAYYRPVWSIVSRALLPVIMLAIPYIVWVDRRQVEPEDGYWHVGIAVLGRWSEVDSVKIKTHALGWLVKGFFLPFMLAGALAHLDFMVKDGCNYSTFNHLFASSLNLLLVVDLTFGSIGYLLTLRALDSQITSTDSTWLGWLSAIICYKPFAGFVWGHFLRYEAETNWMHWLAPYPILFITWGFAIIMLHAIYVWATCSFGCRFSNLTNRGIVVDGPYRYLKHPGYVSKNLAWWLMAVPFIAHGTWNDALRATICLALTSTVYAVRAWTEERHLLHDPAYVCYSRWIEQYGVFAGVRRTLRKMLVRLA